MTGKLVYRAAGVLGAALVTAMASGADRPTLAEVVAALNARAVLSGQAIIGEDGMPGAAPALGAWTVVNGAHAEGAGCSINVAVLAASTAAQMQDVVNSLTGDPRIASVTGILTPTVTPTTAEMHAFDAVLCYTNTTPQSSVALGDNLAGYVDAGGGVVLTMFGIRASLTTRTFEGRFATDNYYCVERSVGTSTTGSATLGTVHVPASPLLDGVTTFNGGTSSFRSPAGLHVMATRIADWSTGQILIAERTDLMGGRVDLNFFAVSQLASGASWLTTTDGALLLRNAVVVASRCGGVPPCRADFNDDGQVNADDLSDYITCFFNPPCQGVDFNGDGEVNADDLSDYITVFFGPPC